MPTIEQNQQVWNKALNNEWQDGGDSWSTAWGGVHSQWFGTILTRIHAFIPTETILEIAPGFGRWTQFLRHYCGRLILVDLAEQCIEACRRRFHDCTGISYHINDGKSLEMVPDDSISFVFSFDSLVHADAEVIEAYLNQLANKLTRNGVGFIHHSNLGSYRTGTPAALPSELKNLHWRSENVSARIFEEYCERAGLQCIAQEVINWGGDILNDCFSVFTKRDSTWSRPNRVFENRRFMDEANHLSQLANLYSVK
jgi:hypothetical protein